MQCTLIVICLLTPDPLVTLFQVPTPKNTSAWTMYQHRTPVLSTATGLLMHPMPGKRVSRQRCIG